MSKMYSGLETGKMNLIVEDPDGKQVVTDDTAGVKVIKSYDDKFKAIEVPQDRLRSRLLSEGRDGRDGKIIVTVPLGL